MILEKNRKRQKEAICDQLRKTPIVQMVCEKIGLGRSTYYRWRKEDDEFAEQVDEALLEGRLLMNDMAESQLLSAIRERNMTAIIFWLKHNCDWYMKKDKEEEKTGGEIKMFNVIVGPQDEEDSEEAISQPALKEN